MAALGWLLNLGFAASNSAAPPPPPPSTSSGGGGWRYFTPLSDEDEYEKKKRIREEVKRVVQREVETKSESGGSLRGTSKSIRVGVDTDILFRNEYERHLKNLDQFRNDYLDRMRRERRDRIEQEREREEEINMLLQILLMAS